MAGGSDQRSDDFGAWYQAAHRSVLAALIVVGRDGDLGREAADEAFARAWERWPRVRTMASPAGWTVAVGANWLRRRARRRSMEASLLERAGAGGGVAPAIPAIELPAGEVWTAVAALPERQRLAVALRYLLDLPEAEVAAHMGVHRGTVASTLSDARRRLAEVLDDPLEEDTP